MAWGIPLQGCMAQGIPLVSWGQLCPFPVPCAPPASSLVGQREKQKRPRCCVSTAQRHLKHPCVISTVLVTNLKHSTIQDTMKNFNSIPAKNSTPFQRGPWCKSSVVITVPQ